MNFNSGEQADTAFTTYRGSRSPKFLVMRFVLLNTSSSLKTCLRLNLPCFGLLNTSSRSARSWLVLTASTFLALCCSTPRVTQLILDLFPSFCPNLSWFVVLKTWTFSCSVVSGIFLSTLTFVGPVLVSFSPLCRLNLLLLMFHLPELLQYFDVYLIAFDSVSVLLLSVAFLGVYLFPTFARRRKKDRVRIYIYIYINK